jgi:hypothetical protein
MGPEMKFFLLPHWAELVASNILPYNHRENGRNGRTPLPATLPSRVWSPFVLTAVSVCLLSGLGCGNIVMAPGPSAGSLVASSSSVAFGSVSAGQTANASVSFLNQTTTPVQISQLTVTGEFFSLGSQISLPATVAPSTSLLVDVEFTPTAPGAATGQLKIISNSASDASTVVGLNGTGSAVAGSFTYNGSAVADTYVPANASAPISSDFFGMTIYNLASGDSNSSTPLTPFPSFPVSTLRLWDVAYWWMLEPSSGEYNWTKMDGTITAAQPNGVNDFIFTFGHVPPWASTNTADPCTGGEGPGTCDPPDMAAFDDFATHVVQRYCGTVKYYEPWNEPNNLQFWDGTNAQLLIIAQHVYQIAKNPANCGCTNGKCSPNGGVNPNKVLLPPISNLSAGSLAWLESYLADAGAAQYPYADIAAFHGYYATTNPEGIAAEVLLLRQTLDEYGLGNLQLWNTEASWEQDTIYSQQQQAAWLMRSHMALIATGVSRYVWYAYDNCTWGTLWTPRTCNDPQGASNQLTPASQAYGTLADWLIGANVSQCQQYQDALWVCELQRPGGYEAWMLWSSNGSTITVPILENSKLKVYRDWQNNINNVPSQISVGQMPVLLENYDFRLAKVE